MSFSTGRETQSPCREQGAVSGPEGRYSDGQRHQPGHDPQESVPERDGHRFGRHHLQGGHHGQVGYVDKGIAYGHQRNADYYASG